MNSASALTTAADWVHWRKLADSEVSGGAV
jgi:hypothetical protein